MSFLNEVCDEYDVFFTIRTFFPKNISGIDGEPDYKQAEVSHCTATSTETPDCSQIATSFTSPVLVKEET